MDIQTTLIIVKPDAIQRGLCGQIIGRFERKGLKIIGCKFMQAEQALAKQHYAEHEGKPFFGELVEFITATPVLVLAIRGPEAVAVCRTLIGATDGREAAAGTIRGDYGLSKSTNLVHGSDSVESAQRELKLWFEKRELQEWSREHERWIHEQD